MIDTFDEWMDIQRERADEHGINNPEYHATITPKPLDIVNGSVQFTCQHWNGCDHVLDGTERFPGWLCDEHFNKENGKWIWPEKRT